MSKYTSLPDSELLPSKMAKLQGLEKYLALNLEIYNFLKNLHQNTPACHICTFYLEKMPKLQGLPVFAL